MFSFFDFSFFSLELCASVSRPPILGNTVLSPPLWKFLAPKFHIKHMSRPLGWLSPEGMLCYSYRISYLWFVHRVFPITAVIPSPWPPLPTLSRDFEIWAVLLTWRMSEAHSPKDLKKFTYGALLPPGGELRVSLGGIRILYWDSTC